MSQGSGATPEQARERLLEVLDETQDALGGDWANLDDPTPRNCTVPLFADGIQYPALRLSGAPGSRAGALETVRDLWQHEGYSIEQNHVGDVRELTAHNDAGDLFIFRVSAEAMTLQGESECRPN